MVQLILLLIITPFLLGCVINKLTKANSSKYYFFFFEMGFLVMVAEFSIVCYPAIVLNTPFHVVCYIVFALFAIECFAIVVFLLPSSDFLTKKREIVSKLIRWFKSPSFWFVVAVCGFQIIRLIIAEPVEMRDSNSYIALTNDILQRDQLFRTINGTGNPVSSILDLPLKFSFSPWYAFISMLGKASGFHSLVLCNTILPPYILLIHYMSLFSLGLFLFEHRIDLACLFTALCAFIYEMTLYCHTPTMIKLIWPVWGKGVLSMTIIPAILILFLLCFIDSNQPRLFWFFTFLLLLVIAGCSMSTMAAIVLPLEISILGLIWCKKRESAKTLVCCLASCVPATLYLVLYYYASVLQNLR